MLSFNKSRSMLNSSVIDFSCYKIIYQMSLRLRYNENIICLRRHSNVMDRLKLDENGNVKLRLDPKVEVLQDKLIYSDYIDRIRLKFGYGKNKAIENSLKEAVKQKQLHELINTPTYSIALKYLRNTHTESTPEVEEDKVIVKTPRNIHMPYSTVDQTEVIEDEKKETNDLPQESLGLNENYQKLYDSYLEVKNAAGIKSGENIKDLKTRISEMERKLPIDKLSNIPRDWMTDYEQYVDVEEDESWESLYGTSNPNIPVSSIGCGGCGASLQCQDKALPGYLPSELFVGLNDNDLKNTICQRCHFMKVYNTALEVTVSPDIYLQILQNIKFTRKKVAIILMIDLTDFPCSIWPDLTSIIGKYTPIFVVGNKVDLLPKDCKSFEENVTNSLLAALKTCGLGSLNIKHVALVSSKTGYGIERLINKLHKIWQYKGDVYMVGCTNVGKSSLFNALLQSDYCKVQAVDLIRRATTSPWPGTTLNLLKFPILNPVRWRLYQRAIRRQAESEDERAELTIRKRELALKRDVTLATLQERIGRTFPRIVSNNPKIQSAYDTSRGSGKFGINEKDNIYKFSRWFYDTPGVIHPDQVLDLLTTEELLLTLPRKIISPRTFIFKPGQTMFLAGLGRIDFLNGPEFIRITVFASDQLPVTICLTENAEYLYTELLQSEAFAVPVNDPERLKIWPTLGSKELSMTGISKNKSVADIVLSSAGWVAITPEEGDQVSFRVWTPEGRGIHLRTPALLSKSVTFRGMRIKSSAAYRLGRQVYTQ